MTFFRMSLLASLCCLLTVSVFADDKSDSKKKTKAVNLKVGDKAPEFKSVGDDGKPWDSADHVGKKIVVVYFYPADMTGGCTKQACGFRDDMTKLKDEGVEVVGVSGDSVANHVIFKKEYDLNFTLLADEKGSVAKAFGVPLKDGGSIKRTVDGKEVTMTRGVTAARWTFVIDAAGKIAAKNTAVKAAEDSQAIMKLVADLKK
ncbi:MAG: peroxiredoxin [Planctomycetota bacterium]|jgi:peroxiredoxin Q/BCP